jgi:FkbM family methyltransferase
MRVRHTQRPRRLASAHLALLRLSARAGLLAPASHALGALLPSRDIDFELKNGRWLRVPISDPYWSQCLLSGEYEPGVGATLELAIAARPDAVLLDCGANIGYWATALCDRVAAVAIEAVPDTYRRLEENARRNGFVAINAALWDTAGETVEIGWSPRQYYAAGVGNANGKHTVEVGTVTVDRLAERHAAGRPLVVKLDIEGAEATALAGAGESGDRCLFVYEDHGGDREHRATRAFLEAGFRIWHVDSGPRPLEAIEQLDEIKRNRVDGYNFAACCGPAWSSLLPSHPAEPETEARR